MVEPHTVRVKIDFGDTGLMFATSPDLKGLLVATPVMSDLVTGVLESIRDLHESNGEDVKVYYVGGNDHHDLYFVIPNWENRLKQIKEIYDLDDKGKDGSKHIRHNLAAVIYEAEHESINVKLDSISLNTLNRISEQLVQIECMLED